MSRLASRFAATAVLLLAGCASSGRQFDTAHVNEIQNGKQDKATIAAWFGEPGQKLPVSGSPAGCTERWLWTYAHAVGFGKVTEAHSLVVDFDAKGLVCDHAYTKQQ
jgi:hypothetical protein